MPTDLQSTAYAAIYGRIAAGVTAYNTACGTGGPLAGICKTVAPLQTLDDRTDGRVRANLTAEAPDSYPKIRLKLAGGDEQKTVTPTFGLAQAAGCDAIVPRKVVLVEEITFDADDTGDQQETPLESYIDAAYHDPAFYPKLGIAYCRGFTFTNVTRKLEKINGNSHLVRRKTINVDLRPHLSVLQ